ncbi:MAG TPA: hypothetical protein P5048_00555 [Chlamydiales bacterium]|nr:hypothetical protein [Chlamydiales bacterium]
MIDVNVEELSSIGRVCEFDTKVTCRIRSKDPLHIIAERVQDFLKKNPLLEPDFDTANLVTLLETRKLLIIESDNRVFLEVPRSFGEVAIDLIFLFVAVLILPDLSHSKS